MDLGLIGCGAVVHTIYSKVLVARDDYRVRFVCDTDRAQAASAAALFGAEAVDLDALTERAEAVVVSTPPSTHPGLVRASLLPGRTIVCEKPFMPTHRDAAEAWEESRASGSRLLVNQYRRVFPQLQLARELVGLGLIGDVKGLTASEGGRFTWSAVSHYTTRDLTGGVVWDTGAHTLDMALFAAGLDGEGAAEVSDVAVDRDRAEPSHQLEAGFRLSIEGRDVRSHLRLSRKQVLPNMVTVSGTAGHIAFITDPDDRVRLSTERGSAVLHAGWSYDNPLEYFDVAFRRMLCDEGEAFAAERFLTLTRVIEALANA